MITKGCGRKRLWPNWSTTMALQDQEKPQQQKNISQDSWCPSQNSKQPPPEQKLNKISCSLYQCFSLGNEYNLSGKCNTLPYKNGSWWTLAIPLSFINLNLWWGLRFGSNSTVCKTFISRDAILYKWKMLNPNLQGLLYQQSLVPLPTE
jgi:hypothetical protein